MIITKRRITVFLTPTHVMDEGLIKKTPCFFKKLIHRGYEKKKGGKKKMVNTKKDLSRIRVNVDETGFQCNKGSKMVFCRRGSSNNNKTVYTTQV